MPDPIQARSQTSGHGQVGVGIRTHHPRLQPGSGRAARRGSLWGSRPVVDRPSGQRSGRPGAFHQPLTGCSRSVHTSEGSAADNTTARRSNSPSRELIPVEIAQVIPSGSGRPLDDQNSSVLSSPLRGAEQGFTAPAVHKGQARCPSRYAISLAACLEEHGPVRAASRGYLNYRIAASCPPGPVSV